MILGEISIILALYLQYKNNLDTSVGHQKWLIDYIKLCKYNCSFNCSFMMCPVAFLVSACSKMNDEWFLICMMNICYTKLVPTNDLWYVWKNWWSLPWTQLHSCSVTHHQEDSWSKSKKKKTRNCRFCPHLQRWC